VRHEQHGAGETVERTLELLDRRDVEMVRRLVEHETVHPAGGQEGDQRTRALAGRERGCVAQDVVGAEPELREQRARLRPS